MRWQRPLTALIDWAPDDPARLHAGAKPGAAVVIVIVAPAGHRKRLHGEGGQAARDRRCSVLRRRTGPV